ncbi:MAG: hypothetical protein EOM84_04525 [Sphingobacteriia bacterium]|nr:hypothetical protein [Sphingobacteriia bacterium]
MKTKKSKLIVLASVVAVILISIIAFSSFETLNKGSKSNNEINEIKNQAGKNNIKCVWGTGQSVVYYDGKDRMYTEDHHHDKNRVWYSLIVEGKYYIWNSIDDFGQVEEIKELEKSELSIKENINRIYDDKNYNCTAQKNIESFFVAPKNIDFKTNAF